MQAVLPAEPLWRLVVGVLAGAATGSVSAWLQGHGVFDGVLQAIGGRPSAVVPWAAVSLAALAALLAWRVEGRQSHRLVWDGRLWSCARTGEAAWSCTPTIALDFGSWILIRATPWMASASPGDRRPPRRARRSVWFAASRRSAVALWHPLRVALQAQTRARPEDPAHGRPA